MKKSIMKELYEYDYGRSGTFANFLYEKFKEDGLNHDEILEKLKEISESNHPAIIEANKGLKDFVK